MMTSAISSSVSLNERTAKQGPECQRIAAISNCARDRDHVLDFLACVEALSSLRGYRYIALFQRALINP